MANGTVPFSHDGFEERTAAIANTISYTSAAENIAFNMGYGDPATKAVEGWLNSSGHLKNIEGNYNPNITTYNVLIGSISPLQKY